MWRGWFVRGGGVLLQVLLMSATVNAELFSTYFGGAPMLSIPGRTFGVDVYHLEDVFELTRCLSR